MEGHTRCYECYCHYMEVFVLRLSHGGTKEQIETESVKNLTKTEDINNAQRRNYMKWIQE